MRKLLALLILALALTVAPATAPAQATPPGWFYLATGSPGLTLTVGLCHANFQYGNFGNIAFARMTDLNGRCNDTSRVKVYAWGDESTACDYISTAPDCWHSGAVVQATATGPLIGGYWLIASDITGESASLFLCPCP